MRLGSFVRLTIRPNTGIATLAKLFVGEGSVSASLADVERLAVPGVLETIHVRFQARRDLFGELLHSTPRAPFIAPVRIQHTSADPRRLSAMLASQAPPTDSLIGCAQVQHPIA